MSRKKDSSDSQQVTLAHGAFVDGKYVSPGEKVSMSADDAAALTASGYVATDEPVGEIGTDGAGSA